MPPFTMIKSSFQLVSIYRLKRYMFTQRRMLLILLQESSPVSKAENNTDGLRELEGTKSNSNSLILFQGVSLVRLWACFQLYLPSPSDQSAPWFLWGARTGISERRLGMSGAPQRSSVAATGAPSPAGHSLCSFLALFKINTKLTAHIRQNICVSEQGNWTWMSICIFLCDCVVCSTTI